ncbi:Choline dehydrogenase [Paraburkholderia caballeronis]|nr:Choline dehydrogenase [Paraburkholderia caballeronis]
MSVAYMLDASGTAVIDRGEPFDPGQASANFSYKGRDYLPGHFEPLIDAEACVMQSSDIANRAELPLSMMSTNVTTFVQGGISNWWGGYSARITRKTFEVPGEVAWPIGYDELVPYYEQAERLMHVHGDPTAGDYSIFGELPGWDYWRSYFQSMFPLARVTPQAKNVSDHDTHNFGLCIGNGHCGLCVNDAKARPANVFPYIDVHGNSIAEEILFEGDRAVAARVRSDGELLEISFDRLVVAAGGIENVTLLKRSKLPQGVRTARIGSSYQDHTACEVLGILPEAFRHFHLGAEGAVEIPELSGYFHGIEVKTLMLTVPPSAEQTAALVQSGDSPVSRTIHLNKLLPRIARFYLQMEVPPEWGVELRSRGQRSFIYSLPYLEHCPILDAVVMEVTRKMIDAGIMIAKIVPHHRNGFGGHHYSGTTAMASGPHAVVTSNQRLIGTSNVYLNGGSVIPRCGGAGPTLSIVALGLRLGEHLR